jgi:hypothetical protein
VNWCFRFIFAPSFFARRLVEVCVASLESDDQCSVQASERDCLDLVLE